jgi:hypothetical protein
MTRPETWRTLALVQAVLLCALTPLTIAAVTIPHVFTNGTIADANEVNANFAAVKAELDLHAAAIADLQVATARRDGSTEDAAGLSCAAIHVEYPQLGDGVYWIDPTGSSPFRATCNMSEHGGGWTLVTSISATSDNHLTSGALTDDGLVALDGSGDKLDDTVIDQLWTDRVWVEITGGSGDIHCELANPPAGHTTWSSTGAFTCGYTFSNTTSYPASNNGNGPTVWINYDYRAYDNPYSGCFGSAATFVPSGSGGCGNHPSRSGGLWVR